MRLRAIGALVAALAGAVNASAQKRGRSGVFLLPRLPIEFEGGGSVGRPLGLRNVNVGILSARLTVVPERFGPNALLLGGGVDHTGTYLVASYGVHAPLGGEDCALQQARARGGRPRQAHGQWEVHQPRPAW